MAAALVASVLERQMNAKFFFLRRFNYIDVIGMWMLFALSYGESPWAIPVFVLYLAASIVGERVTGANE